jgi:hypothetical protein
MPPSVARARWVLGLRAGGPGDPIRSSTSEASCVVCVVDRSELELFGLH